MKHLLNQAEKWLNELGIKTINDTDFIMVSRTDMVNIIGNENYNEILHSLRKEFNTNAFYGVEKMMTI